MSVQQATDAHRRLESDNVYQRIIRTLPARRPGMPPRTITLAACSLYASNMVRIGQA